MKALLLAAGITCLLFACNSGTNSDDNTDTSASAMDTTSSAMATSDDWTPLFDGTSFKGWHTYGKDSVGSAWQIDSGTIHLDSKAKNNYQTKGGGDIITNDEFGDFDLKLQWKISKNGNSGILFYVQDDTTKYKETWNSGLEMQVLDNDGHSDGKIQKHRAGNLYDLVAGKEGAVKPVGEWNQVEIKSKDGKLDLYLNDVNVVSTTLWDDNWKKMVAGSKFKDMPNWGTFKSGHIGLQDHGNDVWYRDIKIKKL